MTASCKTHLPLVSIVTRQSTYTDSHYSSDLTTQVSWLELLQQPQLLAMGNSVTCLLIYLQLLDSAQQNT